VLAPVTEKRPPDSRGPFPGLSPWAGQLDKFPKMPLISVVMSVYNGEHWLAESINSVLNQTFQDFEFIIVNDGSTDRSLQVIEEFALIDRRVRIIDKKNTGLADSLNHGIGHARSEWIARIDADDICEPQRLALQFEYAQSQTRVVLLGTGMSEVDDLGHPLATYLYPRNHPELLTNLLEKRRFFPHASAFYSLEAFRRVGGYRPRIKRAEDYDLWLRLSEVGLIACLKSPLVRIRKHGSQISHDDGGRRQILDSRVALASYVLRAAGATDPVEETSPDHNFKTFQMFIDAGLERERIYERINFMQQLKATIRSTSLIETLARNTLTSSSVDLLFRYLHYRLFGEATAKRLALAWLKQGR
jgi:glycosyltransferase involved in cell wall biosynthesis